MNFTSADRLLIKELVSNGKVNLYTLHATYRLSPAQIADSLMRLNSIKVLKNREIRDGIVELAESGLRELVKYRGEIFRRLDEWRTVPAEMIIDTLEVNAPYVPNYRKLGTKMRARQLEIRKELRVRGRAG